MVFLLLILGASAGAADYGGQLAVGAGKPTVALIHVQESAECKKVRQVFELLSKKYAGRVRFVSLDVSNPLTRAEAKRAAMALQMYPFLVIHERDCPMVGVFCASRKLLSAIAGVKGVKEYGRAIEKALASK